MFTALVIDNDPSQRAAVRDALSDAGCLDIDVATSDHDISSSVTRAPNVIVVDVGDGEADHVQRLARSFRNVPILALCTEPMIDATLAAGALDCVIKPIRRRELRARIRLALKARNEVARRVNRERRMSDAIVALQREKQDLERLACVDPLTGVANRRHTFAMLEAEWKRSAREHLPLAVVMIDLDCYHAYNEQYGHLGGDACLQRVTEAMVTCLRRPADFLGRYGGEEFLVVLPNTDAVGAKIVAERLRAGVEALAIPHEASRCAHVVTITAGFASLRVLGDLSVDKLVATADVALLHAKTNGRNRVEGEAPLVRPTRVSAQLWQRYAPVFADPWFADRIPSFLAEVRDESRAIPELVRAGDHDRVQAIAYGLERAAGELGLPEIRKLASQLDHAAAAHHDVAIRETSEALLQYVSHVQIVYRRPVSAPMSARPS